MRSIDTQRHSKGAPASQGGQFKAQTHTEADLSLSDDLAVGRRVERSGAEGHVLYRHGAKALVQWDNSTTPELLDTFVLNPVTPAAGANDHDLPMPEVDQFITHDGEGWFVAHVDDRTAVLRGATGMKIVSDADLGLRAGQPSPTVTTRPTVEPEAADDRSWDEQLNASARPEWETQQQRRGHAFFPEESTNWPALYATDGVPAADKDIVAHYFSPNADWYIVELDQKTGEAFGYAQFASMPEGAEWGYIELRELETVHTGPLGIVERDCHFDEGQKSSDVIDKYRNG